MKSALPRIASAARRGRAPALALLALLLQTASCLADTAIKFEALKSPKGLAFHYREDATTPFAAISFGMRDIYSLTTRGKEGFNALGTALVMQGADGAGQTEFVERLKDLAASASLTFGPFSTLGNVRAPTSTVAAATALVATALKGAQPSEKLLDRLKQRAIGGEAQAALRAETIAQRVGLRYALGDHPITRSMDPRRFDGINREDLLHWRKATLGRERLRLVVSGRISKAEAGGILDQAFSDLPAQAPSPLPDWPEIALNGGTVVVEHDTPQSAVLLIGLTRLDSGREVETALVANAVLSGSSGRLWQGVRAGLGSTYGASSGFMLVGPGKRLLTMRAQVANEQVEASVKALRAAYSTWRSDGVTAAELKATTARLTAEFRGALDEPTRANGLVIGMQLASRPIEDIYDYDKRIGGLSRDALNKFIADKFPPPEQLITVIVTPKAEGLAATCSLRATDDASRCRK